ncbi:MAG: EboA domain-containing protein [Balneolaceae bacterium]
MSSSEIVERLITWLERRLDPDVSNWLRTESQKMGDSIEDWEYFTLFSSVSRKVGRDRLDPDSQEQQEAEELRSGWNPIHWSVDEVARAVVVLSLVPAGQEKFLKLLESTFDTSEVHEAEALYKMLPLLPWPSRLKKRAAEGVRSNMTNVFNAVAHRNPFPADYFDENAWNQMVLKALFTGSPLYPVTGLDRRANPDLADMLTDFAAERASAGRKIPIELWRPLGPFLTVDHFDRIVSLISDGDELQKRALTLAVSMSRDAELRDKLMRRSDLSVDFNRESLNWERIGLDAEQKSG